MNTDMPIVWQPDAHLRSQSQLTRFVTSSQCDSFSHDDPDGMSKLHAWSIKSPTEFWSDVWSFTNVIGDLGPTIFKRGEHFIDDQWFSDSKLNFAENLIRCTPANSQDICIIGVDESGTIKKWTRTELQSQVTSLAEELRQLGISRGDRIAAVLPNTATTLIAMLATTAIGAIWSSCSPDFGDAAIVDRFSQIEPKILFTTAACQYNGKPLQPIQRCRNLLPQLPTVQTLVVDNTTQSNLAALPGSVSLVRFEDLVSTPPDSFEFERFNFREPAFVLYSSGTTGKPKCIVHSAGGTLLQHLKEHQLHADLRSGDVLMYYTTTGWMMWNWLVSGLASDATVLLYDGNPLFPDDDRLFKIVQQHHVTHFGTSAKFLSTIEKRGCKPVEKFELPSLRCILSTGSPLMPESFDYVYSEVKPDVWLASISGGTDIVSCFIGGNPNAPVHRGEMQSTGLGMDVVVYSDDGNAIQDNTGELVCRNSFPSVPLGFWNDPENERYLASYFERFPNVWCHGDWAQQNSQTGGWQIFGRSDATLNPGGVRIGTAEIYNQVESFSEIAEALAVGYRNEGDEQIVLFVRMQPDQSLTPELIDSIRLQIRSKLSPRHVPAFIVPVPDFPRTISGKMSEISVRRCLHGQTVKNLEALANPESIEFYQSWNPGI